MWANSTALRLNLLAWGGRCPVTAWTLAVRAAGGAWRELRSDGEAAEAGPLRPAAWYELRVLARSPAGDTAALYRAATHTLSGGQVVTCGTSRPRAEALWRCLCAERLGEAERLPAEERAAAGDAGAGGAALWRAGLAPALLGGGLAALLAALAGKRTIWCWS